MSSVSCSNRNNTTTTTATTTIHVKIGELAVSRDLPLTTIVGSCIACCIYDEKNKIAGMAHIMLPTKKTNNGNTNIDTKAKYADTAIKNLVDLLIKNGADLNSLKAKIVGGARIFMHESDTDMFNIGERNAEKVREMLKEYRVTIIAEDVGGRTGRNVVFDPSTLTIKVKGNGYEKIL